MSTAAAPLLSLPTPAKTLFAAGLTGGAIAAVANLVVFGGAKALGAGLQAEFQPGQVSALPFVAVVMASLVPSVAASVVALLLRGSPAGAKRFAAIAVGFALLSMGGPATLAQADLATRLTLALMHVVAAVAIGVPLTRALSR